MIALLGFITSPVGKYIAIALAAVSIVGGAYLWTYNAGASHARENDAAASSKAAIENARKSDAAGTSFDADGAASRLRDGRY
jgi:hypothetical protein